MIVPEGSNGIYFVDREFFNTGHHLWINKIVKMSNMDVIRKITNVKGKRWEKEENYVEENGVKKKYSEWILQRVGHE